MIITILMLFAFICGAIIGPKIISLPVGIFSFFAKFIAFYINIKNGNFLLNDETYKAYRVAFEHASSFIPDKDFNYINYKTKKVLVFKSYFFFKCVDLKDHIVFDDQHEDEEFKHEN